ncbi:GNAT family N-acetyltransferase [Streptococcus pantholopis]|uniref:GNAT family acetyltransferase n=1 Tax=Streptococcus pantholopis TaxID=1811193 RepID=A0A172Q7T3_9STRE|nr:GNAT family N-acetyltransferase [Streptococcus pantholopis]AND79516.1 GNAT family acetyltransferase [Streptococcus pantholopis]
MTIRPAQKTDIPALEKLLQQILTVHHQARPDLFTAKGGKYSREELKGLIADELRPVFVYEDEHGRILGHLFTIIQEAKAPSVPHKTLFIDDLCVDEEARGQKIGSELYQFALKYAREIGCYNLTLNVWNDNQGALRFYERQGLRAQETRLEQIL